MDQLTKETEEMLREGSFESVRVIPDGDFYWLCICEDDTSNEGTWLIADEIKVHRHTEGTKSISVEQPTNYWYITFVYDDCDRMGEVVNRTVGLAKEEPTTMFDYMTEEQ